MPIPTPAPPVKLQRYRMEPFFIGVDESPVEEVRAMEERDDDGDWVKWTEVEALLLQRAQEIEQVKAYVRHRPDCEISNMPVGGYAPWASPKCTCGLAAALVSRAPQPEQDTQQLVQELTAALQERPDRDRTHWAGCHTDPTHRDCAIARLLAALQAAAPLPASAALQASITRISKEMQAASNAGYKMLERWADELAAALSRADQP